MNTNPRKTEENDLGNSTNTSSTRTNEQTEPTSARNQPNGSPSNESANKPKVLEEKEPNADEDIGHIRNILILLKQLIVLIGLCILVAIAFVLFYGWKFVKTVLKYILIAILLVVSK